MTKDNKNNQTPAEPNKNQSELEQAVKEIDKRLKEGK
jgi:hypothetical protein